MFGILVLMQQRDQKRDMSCPFQKLIAYTLNHIHQPVVKGLGFNYKLVLLLSHSMGTNFKVQMAYYESPNMMRCIENRIVSKQMDALRQKIAKKAKELCASGLCAEAQVLLQLAIDMGHLPSRALMAHMLLDGREGVPQDRIRAFNLVEEGTLMGCHDCQGVLARCYMKGFGVQQDLLRPLKLAHKSSESGSRYGQCMFGELYELGIGGVAQNVDKARELYRLAIEQDFDLAQYKLGRLYFHGCSVTLNDAEALRLYQLAAAQGYPGALYNVAIFHELGLGVPKNKAEAIRLYLQAQEAGFPAARASLQRLCV